MNNEKLYGRKPRRYLPGFDEPDYPAALRKRFNLKNRASADPKCRMKSKQLDATCRFFFC